MEHIMTKVNIVFDGVLDDADIIAVPDAIASKIEAIGQEFLYWVPNADDSDYWIIIDGKKYSVAETTGFIKWLNSNYCLNMENAYIVNKNTHYCPQYPTIEF